MSVVLLLLPAFAMRGVARALELLKLRVATVGSTLLHIVALQVCLSNEAEEDNDTTLRAMSDV